MRQSFIAEKTVKNYSRLLFRFINFNRIMQIMEHPKILDLLNKPNNSKYVKGKLINKMLIMMQKMKLSITQKF